MKPSSRCLASWPVAVGAAPGAETWTSRAASPVSRSATFGRDAERAVRLVDQEGMR